MDTEQVHFVVLAPLDLEIAALSKALGFDEKKPEIGHGGFKWYAVQIRSSSGAPINVRIVNLVKQGALYAAICATKLLIEWRPWCLVSFGIAGGFVRDDLSLRDVLIADSVFYYEPAKETILRGERPKGRVTQIVQEEPSVFNASGSLSALAYGRSVPASRTYKIHIGPLASGEKLIADWQSPSRLRILKINRKMLGVEKEAAGVAAAVREVPEIPDVQLLVVKGISDDATISKNETDRKKIARDRRMASRNAAEILLSTIRSSDPPTRDQLALDATKRARVLSAKTLEVLPPHFIMCPSQTDLSRVLHSVSTMPPVYYHWRALDSDLHWVDFCLLRIMNRLRMQGYMPRLLVTEGTGGTAPEGFSKKKYNKIVNAVAGADITWYSDMLSDRVHYVRHAEANGFNHDALMVIRSMRHHWGLRSGNLVLEEWMQYIAWASRHIGRCMILCYAKHANAYMELRRIATLRPLIVAANICIDGKAGKFDRPWSEIHIDPPNYESILAWIKTTPTVEHVRTFCKFLSLGGAMPKPLSAEQISGLENMLGWRELAASHQVCGTFGEAVLELAALLRDWNGTLFKDLVTAP